MHRTVLGFPVVPFKAVTCKPERSFLIVLRPLVSIHRMHCNFVPHVVLNARCLLSLEKAVKCEISDQQAY